MIFERRLRLILEASRFGTKPNQEVAKLEYQYEDYEDYEDYYYDDEDENGFNDITSEDKQDLRTATEDIAELTDRYVAPPAPMNRTVIRHSKSQSDSKFTLEDFGIFPELRPPPSGEEKEEEKKPLLSCPGGNIRDCVDGCVPLAQLWVYSVCVRECARRCP